MLWVNEILVFESISESHSDLVYVGPVWPSISQSCCGEASFLIGPTWTISYVFYGMSQVEFQHKALAFEVSIFMKLELYMYFLKLL